MKKIISIFLSLVMIFSFSLAGYAASPDTNYDFSNLKLQEFTILEPQIIDPYQATRTPDPTRTYYTAEKLAVLSDDGTPLFSFKGRYIWSVETNNPTTYTLAYESARVVEQTAYISTPTGVPAPSINYGVVDHALGYGAMSITISFNSSLMTSLTLIQNANVYPNGYSFIKEWGGAAKSKPI